jgi:MFS family permease
VLVAAIAALIWFNVLQLWHVYLLSFLFGVADAFAIPALMAFLPALVGFEQLTKANSVLQSSMQLTLIAGPPPAGFLIKKLGTMWAFLIDAVSFLFIIGPLWQIPDPPPKPHQQTPRSVWHTMLEGLRYVYGDVAMRSIMGFGASLNFCIMGPVMVGLATLAKVRFGTATAYGVMISAFAVGGLSGSLIAGLVKKQGHRGILLLFLGVWLGILLALVGVVNSLFGLCVLMFLMGVASGYNNIHITAWYQQRVEPAMMGRVMSLRMFTIFGTMPISLAVSGFLAEFSLRLLFISSGALMLVVSLLAATQRPVREVD